MEMAEASSVNEGGKGHQPEWEDSWTDARKHQFGEALEGGDLEKAWGVLSSIAHKLLKDPARGGDNSVGNDEDSNEASGDTRGLPRHRFGKPRKETNAQPKGQLGRLPVLLLRVMAKKRRYLSWAHGPRRDLHLRDMLYRQMKDLRSLCPSL